MSAHLSLDRVTLDSVCKMKAEDETLMRGEENIWDLVWRTRVRGERSSGRGRTGWVSSEKGRVDRGT